MDTPGRKAHWDGVYGSKAENQVSWFQETAAPSLELLEHESVGKSSAVIDIGGGVSRLVDALLDRGYTNLTVLDLSAAALNTARSRLGTRAPAVRWIEADITRWVPEATYDVWHDRAVLHFLTVDADRAAYLRALQKAVRPGGLVVIATFALDGPEKCSGLPVRRYSPTSLAEFLGAGFVPIDSRAEIHKTPWGAEQRFQFSRFTCQP
jgi:SAM-dependent methyltransferase